MPKRNQDVSVPPMLRAVITPFGLVPEDSSVNTIHHAFGSVSDALTKAMQHCLIANKQVVASNNALKREVDELRVQNANLNLTVEALRAELRCKDDTWNLNDIETLLCDEELPDFFAQLPQEPYPCAS